jgi:succinate dehydrogenase/fumarate reductase flavoprotein subunit
VNVPAVAVATSFPFNGTHRNPRGPDAAAPGLFAAGGAGTVWGPFTHSGGGLTDALVFGRLGGQHAARG